VLEIDPQLLYSRSGRHSRFADRASLAAGVADLALFLGLEERAFEDDGAQQQISDSPL
jgi:hypothetical protein